MNTSIVTKNIMQENQLKANKRFGQNFLIDDTILEEIVVAAGITNEDLVIEIGPGLGNLTVYLLERCQDAILIEIDTRMIKILEKRLAPYSNYQIQNKDVLAINLDTLIEEVEKKNNKSYQNIKVVANLPYYITTPILFKLLQDSKRIESITVMVQKEVAERMVASPNSKSYGILSLMVQYLSDAKIQNIVPREAFIPAPNVDSAVILLEKKKQKKLINEELLFSFIHASFAQRRKKLVNSVDASAKCNVNKLELETVLKKLRISENIRAEELSLESYLIIVEEIEKLKNQ